MAHERQEKVKHRYKVVSTTTADSFLSGVAAVCDSFNLIYSAPQREYRFTSKGLRGDWEAVGSDINSAIRSKVERITAR